MTTKNKINKKYQQINIPHELMNELITWSKKNMKSSHRRIASYEIIQKVLDTAIAYKKCIEITNNTQRTPINYENIYGKEIEITDDITEINCSSEKNDICPVINPQILKGSKND
jgi:hypothetical protein